MKKAALFLVVCIICVFTCTQTAYAQETFKVSITDGEVVSGDTEIVFWAATESGLSAKLDGNSLSRKNVSGVSLCFEADGIDYDNNAFFYEESEVCKIIKAEESQTHPLEINLPENGILELTLLPSVGEENLDVTNKYGKYNIDDMSVSGVYLQFASGEKLYADKVVRAMPIVGQSGVIESTEIYDGGKIDVGDGWDSETGLGGTTPNVPVYARFIFDLSKKSLPLGRTDIFELDTKTLNDGAHTLDFYAGSTKVKNLDFVVDNTAPTIVSNLEFGQVVAKDFKLSIFAVDANGTNEVKIKVDGEDYAGDTFEGIEPGRHTMTVIASDSCGNTAAQAYQFTLSDEETLVSESAVEIAVDGKIKLPYVNGEAPANVELYTFAPVMNINGYTLDVNDNSVNYSFGTVTETEASKLPEHYFVVPVSDYDGALRLEYYGIASENADIEILAKENTDWVSVGICPSGTKTVVTVDDPSPYVVDGEITLMARPVVKISSANSLLWVSDTQYYSRFENLYPTYEAIMEYAVDLFAKDEIGYVMHTGDVVDDVADMDFAIKQYEAASRFQKIIDDVGVPNGIVSGNHDVSNETYSHTLFNTYFGADRYADKRWYGGGIDGNTSHYDLITLGEYDFLFMYLGWGTENTAETLAWANAVLDRYSERNAIICVHGYLGADGKWALDEDESSYANTRAVEIWNKIVVPNENVVAVFCGHVPGAARNLRQVEGTDRYVWEILANYQHAETGDEPQNVLNGYNCDGEGYIRLVSFSGNSMTHVTYSPLHDDYNYFIEDKDSFTVDLHLQKGVRTLTTVSINALSAYKKLDIVLEDGNNYLALNVEQDKSHGKIILVAEDENGERYETNIRVFDDEGPSKGIIFGVLAGVIAATAIVLIPMAVKKTRMDRATAAKKQKGTKNSV